MKRLYAEHILSILLVSALLGGLGAYVMVRTSSEDAERDARVAPYLTLEGVDLGDPLHAAILREALEDFYPGVSGRNDSLFAEIQAFRLRQFSEREYKSGDERRGLTAARISRLAAMYGEFILVYVVVMIITYHVTQRVAIFRFVRMKQGKKPFIHELLDIRTQGNSVPRFFRQVFLLAGKGFVRVVSYAVLFSPAYVVAYSIRSGIQTDSVFFLILLAAGTNGLLVNYANRFYTFLVAESRKGYVQTARVKNLDDSYEWGSGGMSMRAILQPQKLLPSHVFSQVYHNARYQYLSTVKEHASFLITGLIIIEMALNIQGHLGYELMQNILYQQFDVVAAIILAIFLAVKGTEVLVDTWVHRTSLRYENKSS